MRIPRCGFCLCSPSVELGAIVVIMPVVILYTVWVYYVLRGQVTAKQIEDDSGHAY